MLTPTKQISTFLLSVTLFICGALLLAGQSQSEYGDVVLNKYSDEQDMRPVIFPHWFHRIRFRCKVCHNELGFEMKAGGNDVNMGAIIDGQFCGLCHNGEIAWNTENCDLCHSALPGLAAGIRGDSETAGPGKW